MLSLVLLVEHNWMIIVYTVVSISLLHQDMGEYLLVFGWGLGIVVGWVVMVLLLM